MNRNIKSLEDLCEVLNISVNFFKYVIYVKKNKYFTFQIPKKSGGFRTIEKPCNELKVIQRNLLKYLEKNYEFLDCQHGFIKGRSCVTNASIHVGQRFVLNCDIQDFFPTIHFGRVRGAFMNKPFNFNISVATYISQIACYNGHLPQGAPTSPIISNIICYSIDKELSFIAKKSHCRYSRYADDITFSTNSEKFPKHIAYYGTELMISDRIINELSRGYKNGFKLNPRKATLKNMHYRQEVTGIIVNKKTNVNRIYVKNIRAILYTISKHGFYEAYKKTFGQEWQDENKGKIKLKNYLLGKINYLKMVKSKYDQTYIKFANTFNVIFECNVFNLTFENKIKKYIKSKCYVIENDYGNGTAFSLSENELITSTHVILDKKTCPNLITKRSDENYNKQFPISSTDIDFSYLKHPDLSRKSSLTGYEITKDAYENDIIKIKMKLNKKRILKLSSNPPQIGETVYMIGYANFLGFENTDLRIIETKIIGENTFFGIKLMNTYYAPNHGMSGGPVLNLNKEVVGIVFAGNDDENNNDNVGFIRLI